MDGAAATAHFAAPFTFASDGTTLFVADGGTIRRIDPTTGEVGTLAGRYGVTGGDDGVGAAASFFQPSGMVARDDALYLTDTENHTLRKIDVATGEVTTIAGAYGMNGGTDGVGTLARFREPEGLALDGGDLYIADTDNDTIRRMDLATLAVTTVAGSAGDADDVDGAGSDARFAGPKALALDHAGNLYVVDNGNTCVRKVVLADATVSTVATFDVEPTGMALLDDALFLSVDQRVVRVDLTTLRQETVAGATNQSGYVDGVGGDARLSQHPAGLFPDGMGGLFLADEGNYVVRRIDPSTGTVTTFAGADSSGSDDGKGGAARFRGPQGLVMAGGDTAFVADTDNHTLRKVDLSRGEVSTVAGAPGVTGNDDGDATDARFDQPSGLAFDVAAKQLYVADAGNKVIRRLDVAAGTVDTVSTSAAKGAHFDGFAFPFGLAMEGGRLFVSDSGKHAVYSLDTKTGEVGLIAGSPGVSGARDGVGEEARFDVPGGVAADGHGHLFVADTSNHVVREIVIATGAVTTIAGALGVQGADDGVGRAARFSYPSALASASSGELFVTDAANNTIRRIDTTTFAVTTPIGSVALAGVRPGKLPAQLTSPSAPVVTDDGRLLFFSENSLLVAR